MDVSCCAPAASQLRMLLPVCWPLTLSKESRSRRDDIHWGFSRPSIGRFMAHNLQQPVTRLPVPVGYGLCLGYGTLLPTVPFSGSYLYRYGTVAWTDHVLLVPYDVRIVRYGRSVRWLLAGGYRRKAPPPYF
jgi:hypothetical protein